jgi:hypothetical protein
MPRDWVDAVDIRDILYLDLLQRRGGRGPWMGGIAVSTRPAYTLEGMDDICRDTEGIAQRDK